jgi:hypothetical protein
MLAFVPARCVPNTRVGGIEHEPSHFKMRHEVRSGAKAATGLQHRAFLAKRAASAANSEGSGFPPAVLLFYPANSASFRCL